MKILIASDIRGSEYYCKELLKALDREKAQCMLLLGDILYPYDRYAPYNGIYQQYMFACYRHRGHTDADLKWTNPLARCNREKIGKKDVPVNGTVGGWDSYDTVFLGFPIWYYGAPNVVNTFCKGYDWSGKKIYVFATSGSSSIGKTAQKLEPYIKGGRIVDARRVSGIGELESWFRE